ncbi:MAG TPA: hypothetical protein VIM55_01120 [Mucilaginibacter sp.]
MKLSLRDIFKIDWTHRRYKLWIVNTPEQCGLYLWDNWKLLLPAVHKLMKLTSQPAFIRTFQSYKHEYKWLGFGRMKWSEENNIKWTTKYRKDGPLTNHPDFFNTEIWAPDWNKVCDTGMPPDIFVRLYNYPDVPAISEGVVIALPRSLYKKHTLLINEAMAEIISHIPGSKMFETERNWWGRTAVRNSIEHLSPQEIRKMVEQL